MKDSFEKTEKCIRDIEKALGNISHNQLLVRNWHHLKNALEKKLVVEKCREKGNSDGMSA